MPSLNCTKDSFDTVVASSSSFSSSAAAESQFYRSVRKPGEKSSFTKNHRVLAMFDSAYLPSINNIREYVDRINKMLACSFEAHVIAYALIERLERTTGTNVTALNIHRLMLISTRIATKFLCDSHYPNSTFALVGGVNVREFNHLEMTFLKALSYRIFVQEDDFQRIYALLWRGTIVSKSLSSPNLDTSVLANWNPRKSQRVQSSSTTWIVEDSKVHDELKHTASSVAFAVLDDDNQNGTGVLKSRPSPNSIFSTELFH